MPPKVSCGVSGTHPRTEDSENTKLLGVVGSDQVLSQLQVTCRAPRAKAVRRQTWGEGLWGGGQEWGSCAHR